MSKQPVTKPSNGFTPGSELPDDLKRLREVVPHEFEFICGIVRGAYRKALADANPKTIRYTERLMDLYGLERSTE